MTTIIMRETNHGVDIAYDSQVTEGSTSLELKGHKVFNNGEIVFGVAGSVVFLNEIKYMKLPDLEEDSLRWLVKKFIPRLRKLVKKLDNDNLSFQLLLAIRGQVFEIDMSFGIFQCADHSGVIGSGSDFALAALKAGATVKDALIIASQLDVYTGGQLFVTTDKRVLQHSMQLEGYNNKEQSSRGSAAPL